MKKIVLALLLGVVSLSANAQFEKGTKYINASLTGLDMNYSKDSRFHFGFEGTGGYFVEECWMPYARIGFDHQALKGPDVNSLEIGAGTRYYFKRTGVYLSGGLLYSFDSQPGSFVEEVTYTTPSGDQVVTGVAHHTKVNNNNISLALEAGYCFYLNDRVSIEPSVFVDMCLNHFKDFTKVGLKIGFGYYF